MSIELYQSGVSELYAHLRKRSKPIKLVLAQLVDSIHKNFLVVNNIDTTGYEYRILVQSARNCNCIGSYSIQDGELVNVILVFPGTRYSLLLTPTKTELRNNGAVVYTSLDTLPVITEDYSTNKDYCLAINSIDPLDIGSLPLGGVIFTKVQTKYILAMYAHIQNNARPLLRQDFVNLGISNPHSYEETLAIMSKLRLATLTHTGRGDRVRVETTTPSEIVYQVAQTIQNMLLSFASDSRTVTMCELMTDIDSRTKEDRYKLSDLPKSVYADHVKRVRSDQPSFIKLNNTVKNSIDPENIVVTLTPMARGYLASWTKINNLIASNFKS